MTFPCTMTDLYDAGYSMNDSDAKIMLGQPASLMIDGYKSYETAICKMEARDFKGENSMYQDVLSIKGERMQSGN